MQQVGIRKEKTTKLFIRLLDIFYPQQDEFTTNIYLSDGVCVCVCGGDAPF